MPAIDHPMIDRFLDALWLEKGLSDNTRDAYRSDLALFNGWLQEKGVDLMSVGREADSRPPGVAGLDKATNLARRRDCFPAYAASIAICCEKS